MKSAVKPAAPAAGDANSLCCGPHGQRRQHGGHRCCSRPAARRRGGRGGGGGRRSCSREVTARLCCWWTCQPGRRAGACADLTAAMSSFASSWLAASASGSTPRAMVMSVRLRERSTMRSRMREWMMSCSSWGSSRGSLGHRDMGQAHHHDGHRQASVGRDRLGDWWWRWWRWCRVGMFPRRRECM
jgi:hypothetical protein